MPPKKWQKKTHPSNEAQDQDPASEQHDKSSHSDEESLKHTTMVARTGMEIEFGAPTTVAATVTLRQGGTRVVVSVRGPVQDRSMRSSFHHVTIVPYLTRSKGIANSGWGYRTMTLLRRKMQRFNDATISKIVQDVFSSVVRHEAAQRQTLFFSIHILEEGGSVVSAIVNACMAALIEGGIACNRTAASATICTALKEKDASSFEKTSALVVNPNQTDEDGARETYTCVIDQNQNLLYSHFFLNPDATEPCEPNLGQHTAGRKASPLEAWEFLDHATRNAARHVLHTMREQWSTYIFAQLGEMISDARFGDKTHQES